ncbi:MAG: hypothetical protein KTR31_25425 [Myxococcales bacterium]|nr:hypothetical protein [Myxococcales bacterium]
MLKLSQKNAWVGVDRTFKQLVDMGLDLTLQDHMLAAQASMESGDMLNALVRLQTGIQLEVQSSDAGSPYQQAKSQIAELQTRYGQVHIIVQDDRMVPALFRNPMPFSAQERQAIAFAQSQLAQTRAFLGLLPAGSYRLDVEVITVEAGQPMQVTRFGN